MKRIKHFIQTRKIVSTLILIALLGIGYWTYAKMTSTSGETSYSVATVSQGSIAKTVSGSGQVSAAQQLAISSKVSGDLTYLNTAANGTEIKKGTLIASIDSSDAQISLRNAQISYEKLVKPADAATMLQAENGVTDAEKALVKAYADGYSAVVDGFIDMPILLENLKDLLSSGYLESEQARSSGTIAFTMRKSASASYDKAAVHYSDLLREYQQTSPKSSSSTIESLISKTYALAGEIALALKDSQSAIEFIYEDKRDSDGVSARADIASWIGTASTLTSSLLSAQTSVTSSAQTLQQKKLALADLKDGPDSLDIESEKLTLLQKQNDYQDYFIRAPFDGLLAKISVKMTDPVNNGTGIATLVSRQKIATISLNEVDTVNVKVGQKARVTFDAIDDLTLEGTVSSVDQIGTVSQGVVSYDTEIAFDTNDSRVKSGMSVSVNIITESKDNVLVVPNSAVKTLGNKNYVEVFTPPITAVRGSTGTPSARTPERKFVEVGLADDDNTEITSGLSEGDQVVTKTTAGTSTTQASATPQNATFFGGGARSGTGGAVRIQR